VITRAQLSGKFPDLPTTNDLFDDYQQDVQQFSEEINKRGCENPELIDCNLVLTVDQISVSLTTQLAVKNNVLVHYRSSSAKAKDKFIMYLQQLVVQVWQQQTIANETTMANSTKSDDDNTG